MPEVRSPTVRRRELGALLRTLRTARGMTVDQVAAELLCSPSKVSRMETGQRGATARDVRDLCDIYGVTDPAERNRMARLAAEGKQQGWWQSYELDNFAIYVGLEEDATAIKQYQSTTIPGLLQTAEYARATADVLVPEASPGVSQVSPARLDEFVEVKLRRQGVLARESALPFSVVVDEAVLHRAVGGPVGMSAQLDHLVQVTQIYNVTIQVIPYSVGAHPAMDSTFTILEFANPIPSVVYVEGLIGSIYLERPQDIARYQRVFEHLRTISMTPQESVDLIAQVSADYRRVSASA